MPDTISICMLVTSVGPAKGASKGMWGIKGHVLVGRLMLGTSSAVE